MQVSLFLVLPDTLFHSVAAAFVMVLYSYVTVWVHGTVNRMVDSDRKESVGLYTDNRPLKYTGDWRCIPR